MSLETTGLLYTGPNQTGQSQLIGMSLGDRYNHANGADLQRAGFYNNVQSGRLYDSSRVDVSITLLWDDSFHDAFVQMTAARGNGYIDFWVTGGPRSCHL